MENGMLTIKGERSEQKHDEDIDFVRIERSHGTFYRRFSLPDTADAQNISATSKNGVLEVSIPKLKQAVSKRIDVTPIKDR